MFDAIDNIYSECWWMGEALDEAWNQGDIWLADHSYPLEGMYYQLPDEIELESWLFDPWWSDELEDTMRHEITHMYYFSYGEAYAEAAETDCPPPPPGF